MLAIFLFVTFSTFSHYKQVAEKVLNGHITELRKNVYVQNAVLLERHCRPIVLIITRCLSIVEGQKWENSIMDKIYLKEIQLGMLQI